MLNSVAMYVQLLTRAFADHAPAPDDDLVARARTCRADLAALESGAPTQDRLSVEIRYDLSLLWLCASLGVGSTPSSFCPADVERRRLEGVLAERGMEIATHNV